MTHEERIRAAWQGRISGCLLGKPVEMISMREGPEGLNNFLEKSGSLPLRDYVNYMEHDLLRGANKKCCAGMMIVADKESSLILSGNGDVLEPKDGLMAIGSGGNYALAAARALYDSKLNAEQIAKKSLEIAADLCIYTNDSIIIEKIV